ncbi:ABC transporter permease [Longirhabdus pacifica]|uniref:ABC transporter permease n=1 Tax=Longirhabdus pacifica TaxID=2305227 RepID=UPI0010091359|nr:ABC transporter permease [Longirhabdus pacifica]
MRGYGQLVLAQFRLFLRNKQMLFWSLMFPIFLMTVIGFAFNGEESITFKGIIIDEDQSALSNQLSSLFLEEEVTNFALSEDKEQALTDLENGDISFVFVIPEQFESLIEQQDTENKPKTVLYYDQTNQMISNIAIPIIENNFVDQMSQEIASYEPVIQFEAQGVQALDLQYFDFLVPGIVAMMIMTNNLNGSAGQISSWRERGILRRMQSTTLHASSFISAQITARLVLNAFQVLIVILIGNLLFGVQVNGSWLLLLTFILLGTLTFMSIGFIIAGLAKNPESAGPISGFIAFPMLFLGGVFFPLDNMPEFLQPILETVPIAPLSTAMRQVMNVGAGLSDLWLPALYLVLWLLASFIVASLTFKWDDGVK